MFRRFRLLVWIATALAGLAVLGAHAFAQDDQPGGVAYSFELSGSIDPATERWVGQALADAEEQGAELAIIRMDTPGGLDTSTRSIVQDIIGAEMPVVVYVSPDGARAASAGLFITMASDVAAMAPQTNIGSATPISLGPGEQDEVLGRKIENDAAAYVRALAEGHDRNGHLAELMVTEAENVTAGEALDRNLIDVVAANQQELLAALDGYEVKGPKEQVLDTAGLVIEEHEMPFHLELLQILVNPNMAFLLMLVGLAGMAFELFNPGLLFPGGLGLIFFLLGLYATAQLPVTAAGVALLVLGIGMILAETQLPTSGVLGGVGVVGIALGGLLLFDTQPGFGISPVVVIATAVIIGGFLAFAIHKVIQARHGPVHTGWEELIGFEGEVRQPIDPVGQVFVDGGLWRAAPAEGVEDGDATRLRERGVRVRVDAVEGLTLRVRPL